MLIDETYFVFSSKNIVKKKKPYMIISHHKLIRSMGWPENLLCSIRAEKLQFDQLKYKIVAIKWANTKSSRSTQSTVAIVSGRTSGIIFHFFKLNGI